MSSYLAGWHVSAELLDALSLKQWLGAARPACPQHTWESDKTLCVKQCVTGGPARGLNLPHTDHSQIKAWVIVFQSAHTQTDTHGPWCYITVENSKVKLELLCVGLRVYDGERVCDRARGHREMRKNSVFSEPPMPPIKRRWFCAPHMARILRKAPVWLLGTGGGRVEGMWSKRKHDRTQTTWQNPLDLASDI